MNTTHVFYVCKKCKWPGSALIFDEILEGEKQKEIYCTNCAEYIGTVKYRSENTDLNEERRKEGIKNEAVLEED